MLGDEGEKNDKSDGSVEPSNIGRQERGWFLEISRYFEVLLDTFRYVEALPGTLR